MVITNLKIEFSKIKFKRKAASTGIKGKRQGHTILENRSDSEKKENMTMRKWRTLLAGLVLTFAVSAMAACGTNNDKVYDTTNGTGTESTVAGNDTIETTNGTTNGTNGTPNGTNGTTNGTVNDTNGTLNDNGAMDNNGAADNKRNGNVVDDVVDGVGEAGKDVINGVENGVDDLTGNDNNNNGTTDNNGNGR